MENKKFSYSVLMSVYKNDKGDFLDKAIESMNNQTIPFNDFVLVCDGPLSSNLNDVIAKWKLILRDKLQVIRLKRNYGLGYALNAGLKKCSCEIVARMDSDDISRVSRCQLLLKKMKEENLDLVGGAIEEFDVIPGDLKSIRKTPLQKEEILKWAKSRNPFNHMTVMFRKQAVFNAGGYLPFRWMEDYWLWVRMLMKGVNCANISDVVVDVRVGNGMYYRRSNIKYFIYQCKFYCKLQRIGFVNVFEAIKSITQRLAITLIPKKAVKFVYNRLLRAK